MFSVVIPLYNKEFSIKNTLNSVLEQTYQEFEIIVIDDGSTDGSLNQVKELNSPKIRLLQQENRGVSATRNLGIEKARYEWIAFLDSDDFWKPNHLEEILKAMQKFPDEKVYTTSFEFSNHRKPLEDQENDIYIIENYFKEALEKHLISTGTIVINKKCFFKVDAFNSKLCRGEDLDLWMRLAKNYQIVKSNSTTVIYNQDDPFSLTKSKSKLENSVLSIIDLKDKKSFERKYLKRMIYNRIKLDIKDLDIKDLYKVLAQHKLEIFK